MSAKGTSSPPQASDAALASRRALAHVSGAAISANVRQLRTHLQPDVGFCAVVKADGYGHGLLEAARAALNGGADRLAVVTLQEAELLTGSDPGVPVLLLGPLEPHELAAAVATGAELTAWTPAQVAAIERAAAAAAHNVPLHIKLDTGMGRFGTREADEALAALAACVDSEHLTARAVWTHFATADELGDDYFPQQLERFNSFVAAAREQTPGLLAHAANSAALLRDPASHFDFVRSGIAIYGLDPFGRDAAAQGLTPALSLTSYVAALRTLEPGESVGYGRRFTADSRTTIATVPIGYGDGWRRILSNNCEVLIDGRRHPQRGTVSMDSMMVELGEQTAQIGAAVTLIGRDGDELISCEDVAAQAQTINYEITCGLTARTLREHSG